MKFRLVVFYGSVRSERRGIRAARFMAEQCRRRGHEVVLIDPAEHRLPLLDKMYKEYKPGEAPETLEKLAGWISAADGYVVVSGEYNHNIPPALSNMLDHFLEEYFWKPSGIVCYSAGSFGGVRAAISLRSMLAELGMPTIPSVMPIPRVQQAFEEDGSPRDQEWFARAERFLGELEWYLGALKAARIRDGKDVCPSRSFCETEKLVSPASGAR